MAFGSAVMSDGTGLNRTRTVSLCNTAENGSFFATKFNRFCGRSSSGGSATVTQTLQPIVPTAMFVNEQLLSRSHWKYWIDTYYIILFKSRKHLAHTLTNVCLLENTCWSLTLKHLISFSIYSNPFIPHDHLGKSWQKMQGGRPFKTTWWTFSLIKKLTKDISSLSNEQIANRARLPTGRKGGHLMRVTTAWRAAVQHDVQLNSS